jgi:glycine cleavage system H protein
MSRVIKFTQNGEWIESQGKVRKVGLSLQNAQELGEVTFISEASLGKSVKQGEPILSLEASKAAFDLYAPLDGIIRGINPAVLNNLGLLNSDPYGQGWLIELEVTGGDESVLQVVTVEDTTIT